MATGCKCQTYNPYGRKQQADLDVAVFRVDRGYDDIPIQLRANADAHDAKVHQHQRPEAPVDQHIAEVLPCPRTGMVHPLEVLIVNHGVLALEGLGRCREEPHEARLGSLLPRWEGTVGKPPQKHEAEDDGQRAIDEEHPLEAHEPAESVHLLEAGRHEPHDGGRDLGGGEVVADPLPGAARGVEQGQIVAHAGPHAGDDDAQQEAEQLHAPGGAHSGEAHADQADGEDDAGHPDARGQAAHDEVGRAVEEHIGDVEEGQGGGGVAGGEVQHLPQVVALVRVHGLGETDVGADGAAEEVQDPEGCGGC